MVASTILVSGDLVLDENLGLQDDEILYAFFTLTDDALETYVLGLAAGAPTGFPHYAREQNFITSSSAVSDFALVQDNAGTAFSTVAGEGVDNGAADVVLSDADFDGIRAILEVTEVRGDRYPAALATMTGR